MSVVAVVPTLGRSPHLERCLQALGGPRAGVVRIVVAQRVANDLVRRGLAEHELHAEDRLGFSAATNLGIDAAESEYVATVNDDAIVDPEWLGILRGALEREPRAAGAQGVNLQMAAPLLVDGCGMAWNRRWEAVQIGHGKAAPPVTAPEREIYGVSATAALYRRSALDVVRGAHGIFDERLDSFYEDVDLAGRLRAAGFTARLVPRARAEHAGSTTASTTAARHVAWIYGNRHLVLAALLGGEASPARSLAWRTDLRDAVKSWRSPRRLAGILGGAERAWRHLPEWRRDGPPLVTLAELDRLRDD